MEEGEGRWAPGAGRRKRVRDFQDLEVWKKGRLIAGSVYRLTGIFPAREVFGLSSQMRRSVISITSNIAEGFNRRGSREFGRFVSVALGSRAELRSLLLIAEDQEFIRPSVARDLENELNSEERMLGSLHRSLLRSPSSAPRPAPRPRRSP